MTRSACRIPGLLLLALLLTPLVSRGQRPSHLDDPSDPLPSNILKLLDGKLPRHRTPNIDQDFLRRLIEQMPRNIDPKMFDEKTVKDFIQKNPELSDPKNIERIREMIKEQQERQDPTDPKVNWKKFDQAIKKVDEFRKEKKIEPIDPKNPKVDPTNPENVRASDPEKMKTDRLPPPKQPGRQNEELAKWISKNFGNSPATQDIVKDIARIMANDNSGGGVPRLIKDLEKEWKNLGSSKTSANDASSSWNILTAGLKLPDLNLSGSGGSRSISGDSGSFGSSSVSSLSSSGGSNWSLGSIGIALVVTAVLVGLFFWFRKVRSERERMERDADTRKLWPVDPMTVASREDVIKAFEYLSVSKCGMEAMNWHHNQIAKEMRGLSPDLREAVETLAGLYEKARYAPAIDRFTESEIAEARSRLCQIAGVTK
ncbi:MAG: DUF4129 domain-containing protein, partial [Planctomycetes bacterium]|nr:DUF4129 domain-containing protein [Planctomycetota bacterium]